VFSLSFVTFLTPCILYKYTVGKKQKANRQETEAKLLFVFKTPLRRSGFSSEVSP
jgi:hypothetical protein